MGAHHAFLRRRNRGQGDGGDRRRAGDIKAPFARISVAQLFGGPTQERVRCTGRTAYHAGAPPSPGGKAPIESWNDITALAKEVVARGFTG